MDDIYYYRARCLELESELFNARKTIDRYRARLYDIRKAVEGINSSDPLPTVDAIRWIAYDWND